MKSQLLFLSIIIFNLIICSNTLAIEPGRYGTPYVDGYFIINDDSTGLLCVGGADLEFYYKERNKKIFITYKDKTFNTSTHEFPPKVLNIINNNTLVDDSIEFYHESIEFPLWDIFVKDTLGQTIAYFETKVGPAKRKYGKFREYIAGPCSFFVVGVENIDAIGIEELSPRCTFSLHTFDNSPDNFTSKAHYQNFAMFDTFYAECFFAGCGNSGVPTIYGILHGPHSMDFIEIMGKYQLVDPQDESANTAINKWIDAIVVEKGRDWFLESVPHNDKSCDFLAADLLSDIKITGIMIGYDLGPDDFF